MRQANVVAACIPLTPSWRSATLAATQMPDIGPNPAPLSYAEALHRLLSLADYERMAGLTAPAYKHDLGRMRELAERMGNPHARTPAVHITGTKGKGSVAAMVTSILRSAGLRVVTFTSPHLHTFRERIRVDGEPCTEEQFARAMERVWPHVGAMAAESAYGTPTTFEALTAMAFNMARGEQADVQVLEVGLGGRLDSTNIVDAAVSVITSISLDHTTILGDTVEAIAAEKAGIIKSNAPVVVAPQLPAAMAVVEAAAGAHGAPLVRVGRDVTWEAGPHDLTGQTLNVRTPRATYGLRLPLLGAHQQENAAVAVAAVEAMGMGVTPEQVAEGMRSVRWDGRFQVLEPHPNPLPLAGRGETLVIVDGAHNAYSMARLCDAVREYLPGRRVIAVFGCSSDKNAQTMVDELARLADHAVVSMSHHPRAMWPEALRDAFQQAGVACDIAPDVAAALDAAKEIAGPEGVVLVTGSLFVVAEALEAWQAIPGERYPEFDPHRTAIPRGNP